MVVVNPDTKYQLIGRTFKLNPTASSIILRYIQVFAAIIVGLVPTLAVSIVIIPIQLILKSIIRPVQGIRTPTITVHDDGDNEERLADEIR